MSSATATASIATYGIPTTTEPLTPAGPATTTSIATYGIPTTTEAAVGGSVRLQAPPDVATVLGSASRLRGYRVAPLVEAFSPNTHADPQRSSEPAASSLSAPTLPRGAAKPDSRVLIGGSVSFLETADPAHVEADAVDAGLAPAALRRQIARYAAFAAAR